MGPVIYFIVATIFICIFIWLCRYLDRKRRIKIYIRMLHYIKRYGQTGFCETYKSIVYDHIDTDRTVYNELLQESKKLDTCLITDTFSEYDFWFPIRDIESRRIVLLNLINKLSKQWI